MAHVDGAMYERHSAGKFLQPESQPPHSTRLRFPPGGPQAGGGTSQAEKSPRLEFKS